VDPAPDTDPVGSASFCRVGIGIRIQGMPIRININSRKMKKLISYTFLQKMAKEKKKS
jgi:hypothetical protein